MDTPTDTAMVTTLEKSRPRSVVPPPPDRGNSWWGSDDDPQSLAVPSWQFGMWLGLGTLTVLFAALSSAYIVRVGGEPLSFALPSTLWISTAILVANSIALIQARRLLARKEQSFVRWLAVSFVFALGFLVSQVITWSILASQGVFMTANPHSSFFYVLTAVHGLHVVGGLGALLRCGVHVRRRSRWPQLVRAVGMTATYWHFVDAVWLWIVFLFLWTSL
ncbi:MAG: cytochrome-c oxidase [Candidatus Kapaibacterium sp.]|nr:MAG: cytochrome-c oxidase [Candidatus Kapabacteria bacterium]